MRTEPVTCPEFNVSVFRARRSYHCDCEVCQGPAEREVEPTEEQVKKQLRKEKLSEEIMEGTLTSYDGGGRPREGAGIPDAAVDDVKEVME